MSSIKILIADDHQMILEGLKSLLSLSPEIEIVAEANDGEKVLELVESLPELDQVILDINMPSVDGIEVTKKIKSTYPEIKILILSMYNRQEFIKNLIESGADGYILKNSDKAELLGAIHSLHKGEPYFGKEVTKTIMKSFQKEKPPAEMHEVPLTEREKDIVKLIAETMTTSEIAEKLFLSTHTVDTHRKNILSKLEVKNVAGLVRYAIQTGLIKDFDW
ncbi:MAG: response regulator transcription factor [Bacteroidota bacterium]